MQLKITPIKYTLNIPKGRYEQPSEIHIITYTFTTELGSSVHLYNLGLFCILEKGGVEKIKSRDQHGVPFSRCVEGECTFNLFSNQATVIITTVGREHKKEKFVNIKIFNNGKIQMTGCRDRQDAADVIEKLVRILGTSDDECGGTILGDRGSLQMKMIEVCMINSKFSLNFQVDRRAIVDTLNNLGGANIIKVKFNPVKHQGVNVKILSKNDKTITIIIFQNGKILITGVKSEEDMEEGYEFINDFMKNNFTAIHRP